MIRHSFLPLRAWLLLLLAPLGMLPALAQSAEALQREGNAIYRTEPAKALRLFGQARQLALRHKQADLAANIRVDEATVYNVMYDNYQQSTTICRAGLQLSPLADSTRFKLWASLGELYHLRNRPDSLNWFWQRANALLTARHALERETPAYVAVFWSNQGMAYLEQGDYRRAETCFQKRLLLLANQNTLTRQAIAENQFAYFYLQTNQPALADSLFRASLQHYTAPDLTRGWLLLGLIECRLHQKRTDSVLLFVREARQCVRRAGADGAELAAYLNQSLGKYREQKNQLVRAKGLFARSLVMSQRLAASYRLQWRGLMAMSRIARQQNDLPGALAFAQRAIQQASIRFQSADLSQNPAPGDFLNGPDLFESLCQKARLLRSAGEIPNHLRLADQTFERAFALSDLLQGSYSSELTKLFVQEKLRPAYREAVAVAYARYRQQPDPATLATLLHRQEQGNASVLHELLQTLQKPYANAPPHLIEALQQAKSRLSEAKTVWVERNQAGVQQSIDPDLVNAELAWSRAYQKLQPYSRHLPTQPNELKHLQSRLDRQTAFLQYSLTPDSLLLTVVKANTVRVQLLPISGADLNRLSVLLRREAYRNPDPFQYAGQATARALFERLLGPVWTDLQGITRLMIVRDGPLHYVPFEVLETGLRPDDYLLRYAAITYAYAMNRVAEGQGSRPDGNPSVLSMAPFAVTKTALATVRQWGYEPLAGSDVEAEVLSGTHSTANNASKSTFLALLPQHQLLHLATHAEASDTDPGNSNIAFFPADSSHRLYAHELDLLDLRHIRLAVLSACRTGSGQFHEGEGLLSLSRAFASAGCPQVITSLWNANDGTTATLTRLFYEELRRGQPTDVALQQAKLRFLTMQATAGAFTPPHFWAHLILMGNHQPVYPGTSGWLWSWLGFGITVFLGFSTYILYRYYQLH
ncbi:CHAT domain-containing tetratricopeptide repeat protein [Larkinella punicea]|uniref:CHAT domain-containing protein n=1 Tax=Larkinella punicea TaxID=2315727 RepID=A0A368JH53_9BACT|nr:CHAT domain-containing protein [Larkinella punicea]RCR66386.1 CHAT domain-containing protein [Larkinella punicea]